MKKLFVAVAFLAASAAALASGTSTTGVVTEVEFENGKNGHADSRTVSVAPFYTFSNKVRADVKFEGSRDTGTTGGNNNDLTGAIEARVRRDYDISDRLSAGLRVGVGEKFNGTNRSGVVQDYSYYTIEPIAHYELTDRVGLHFSYRFRSAFDTTDYAAKTNTAKVGVEYALTKQDTVAVKYSETYGDTRSNGVEFKYIRGF